tara:strand:- start:1417 stop:1779 length:363 start_codon:yes stop_codon:yes gene_type:complete
MACGEGSLAVNWSWILVLLAGINSTFGNILLKKSQETDISFVKSLLTIEFLGGIFFYGLNVVFFAIALRHLEVSKAYPVLASISFITLLFMSFLFLNEPISISKSVGIILILMGIFFLTQ